MAGAASVPAENVATPVALSVVNAPVDGVEAPTVPLIFMDAVPVKFVTTPLLGVPSAGVTRVGLVANTKEPVPVSPVTADAKLAEDGVVKKVATPVPKPATPVEIGNPVALVNTPDEGVPSAGVTRVGLVFKTLLPVPVLATLTTFLLASSAKAVEAVRPDSVVVLEVLSVVNAPVDGVEAPTVPLMLNAVAVPVMFVPTRAVGVPNAGVTSVGLVANTLAPVPVSSVSAVASCADVNEPNEVALPTEVTAPVRLALVVTLPAVRPAAVPVMFVPTRAEGVPSAGVTNVGDVDITTLPVPVMALDTKFLDASVNTATDAVKSVT